MPGATDAEPPELARESLPDNPWSWVRAVLIAGIQTRFYSSHEDAEIKLDSLARKYAEELAPHLKQQKGD